MAVEQDPAKARSNLFKHGIRFSDAVTASKMSGRFPRATTGGDEERWIATGMDGLARLLAAVYTWRDEQMRLISARLATPRKRRQYEESQ